jgi:hypothetical protein
MVNPTPPPGWWLYRQLMTLTTILIMAAVVVGGVELTTGAGSLHAVAAALFPPVGIALAGVCVARFGISEWCDYQFRKRGRL